MVKMPMKIHQEWTLVFEKKPEPNFHTFLRGMAKSRKGWKFDQDASDRYQKSHGSAAGYINLPAMENYPKLWVAAGSESECVKSGENRYRIFNIFPVEPGIISVAQYNHALRTFDKVVKGYLKQRGMKAKIRVTPKSVKLEHILPGAYCRKMFLTFLHGHPRTFHPSDLLRLDRFTGAVLRYRQSGKLDYLPGYLKDELGWSAKEAIAVLNRIRVGLDVLIANR